jgi:hypothetical protein
MLCPAKPAMERGPAGQPTSTPTKARRRTSSPSEWLRGARGEPLVGDVVLVHADGDCDWLEGMPPPARGAATSSRRRLRSPTCRRTSTRCAMSRARRRAVRRAGPADRPHHGRRRRRGHRRRRDPARRRDHRHRPEVRPRRGSRRRGQPAAEALRLGAAAQVRPGRRLRARAHGDLPAARGGVSERNLHGRRAAGLGARARHAGRRAGPAHLLRPGVGGRHCRPHEDACRFCKAKADCQALPPRCRPPWAWSSPT